MKRCKHCGSVHREYQDQIDNEGRIFHVVECVRGCHRVVSFQSITNARKLWNEQNIVTRKDQYDAVRAVTGFQFLNEKCEEIRNIVLEYERKINGVQ